MNNQLSYKNKNRLLRPVFRLMIICVVMCVFYSCDEMTDNYQQFMEGGEVFYPGKADSIHVYPGKYRIGLSWLIMSDPSVVSARVYWNNSKDSTVVPIVRTTGIDTVNIILDNMLEQSYTFDIVTLDNMGNRSVKAEVIGAVYGDKYRSTLLNRAIKTFSYSEDEGVNIKWENADEGTVSEQIIYEDREGETHTVNFEAGLDSIWLRNYKASQGFIRLSTIFIPDSTAIDTFKTAYEEIALEIKKEEKEVDKSALSLYSLPGDYSEPNAAASTVNNIWKNENVIVDGNSTYLSKVNGHSMPQWFTIDLGAEFELTKMKLFQRGNSGGGATRLYAGGNLREFEIWGSASPDANYNPDEHNGEFGETWTLLQTCTVNRPSGNIVATTATRSDNTSEDIAAAMAGHEFSLQNAEKIRYIRIKATGNWDSANRAFVNIASVAFWAMQY
ncbi:MAG: DUF4998 domain-containing protein [Prolixibacteraceae bacterium]